MTQTVTINPIMVKQLREKTGAGMLDCKKALTEAGGDIEAAMKHLREKGVASAAKRAGRSTSQGMVDAYLHMGGKIGVLVEVNCETDFVARNIEFQSLVRDIAMQIAATNPQYTSREEVPEDILRQEKEILKTQAQNEGKPETAIQKIVEGRLEKFFSEVCLLDQPYIRDTKKAIRELIAEHVGKIGENIQVKRFVRYQLGE